MRNSAHLLTSLLIIALILFASSSIASRRSPAYAHQESTIPSSQREQGITLYKQGNFKGAINQLRLAVKQDKTDADAWRYLGLALNSDGDPRGARKAFEIAIKLRPLDAVAHTGLAYVLLLADKNGDAARESKRALELDAHNGEAHYIIGVAYLRKGEPDKSFEEAEAAIAINPNYGPAFLLKTQALVNKYLIESFITSRNVPGTLPPTADALQRARKEQSERSAAHRAQFIQAAESLARYLQLTPNSSEANSWREQLGALRVYARLADESDPQRSVFLASEVTTKVRILAKPEPEYTVSARQAQVVGVVVLRAVLASDGTVQNIFVFRSLSHGLTEQAIKAARKIKFTPATKDGHPVSQAVMMEYYFNLY